MFNNHKLILIAAFILNCSLALAVPPHPVTCMTSNCHSVIPTYPFKHGPIKAKGCEVCHLPGNSGDLKLPKGHPSIKPILKKEINSTCLICHDQLGDKLKEAKVVHSAIEKKGCTACHNPHGSTFKNILRDKASPNLCLTCHDDIKNKMASAHSHHSPAVEGEACLGCHAAHISDEKNLLKKPANELCIGCHSKEVKTSDGRTVRPVGKDVTTLPFVHKPVGSKCQSCHSPHGGKNGHLLDLTMSQDFYSEFEPSKYSLCMDCHEPTLVTSADTTSDTDFRNGSMNLHNFHVQKRGRKGMGCLDCHDVHASKQPKMIKEWTNFNGLQLPIVFKKTENGGNCMTACHGLKSYDRSKGVTNAPGR